MLEQLYCENRFQSGVAATHFAIFSLSKEDKRKPLKYCCLCQQRNLPAKGQFTKHTKLTLPLHNIVARHNKKGVTLVVTEK